MEDKKSIRAHKNIRSAEYYAQATKEATERENEAITPILRLREFVNWVKSQGLCRSEYDFERQCSLSPKYITNNMHTGKGNIGTEMLGRIIRVFPQLNLTWLCTGDGTMIVRSDESQPDTSGIQADYKLLYEAAMTQIEVLNRILRKKV